MGYAYMMGPCFACGKVFSFNPVKVPSLRDDSGNRQPICANCISRANARRKNLGMAPFPIHLEAYEPCQEEELA